jgi:transposase
MLYVDIDITKKNHEASLINEQGKLEGSSFFFSNTLTDFQRPLERFPKDALETAMEETGHYWLPLHIFLYQY